MTVVLLLLRRLLTAGPILLLVSFLLFIALRILPVDPAAMSLPPTATTEEVAAQRAAMGLDRPLVAQYGVWLADAARGRLGRSIALRRDAGRLVADALPPTIELAAGAMLVAGVLGLGGGLALFAARGTWIEAAGDLASTLMVSVPDFLWALLLLLAFGVLVPVLPFLGRLDPGLSAPGPTGLLVLDGVLAGRPAVVWSALRHLTLPVLSLGIAFAPPLMRVLRSGLLDAYQEDYIRVARLRGVSPARLLLRHALQNAVLPALTLMGVQFGFLFGGTLLIEVIYGIPGIGNLMVDAVRNADLPVIQAVGLCYCVVVLAIGLAVDGLVLALDPRGRA